MRNGRGEAERTWDCSGGTTASLLVDSGDVALETSSPGLGKLGHVAQIVEHRLEDDVGVVLPCQTRGENTRTRARKKLMCEAGARWQETK